MKIGRFVGKVAGSLVRTVNLPAEAVDRLTDFGTGDTAKASAARGDIRFSDAGRSLAKGVERLFETLDDRR